MDPLTFMQLADTQFGMFRNFIDLTPERLADYNSRGLSVRRVEPFDGFAPETERFEKAVDAANTIRPAFVAICGDMVNDPTDEAQIAELNRISGGLSSESRFIASPATTTPRKTITLPPRPRAWRAIGNCSGTTPTRSSRAA